MPALGAAVVDAPGSVQPAPEGSGFRLDNGVVSALIDARGLLVSLVTGLALAAPWPAGIELNYPKIGIKLVILLVLGGLLGMGSARQKRTGEAAPRGMFYAAGLLSLTAAGIAVIW